MIRPNFLRFPVWHIVFAAHIRLALLAFTAGILAFLCLAGAYWGGDYIATLHREVAELRADNQAAMDMLSGKYYTDGTDDYRMEEVKLRNVIGGL